MGRRIPSLIVAGLALAAFGSAAPAPAAAQQDVTHAELRLGYTCGLPVGEQRAVVRVAADFPVAGTVGTPVGPAAARLALTMQPPTDLPGAVSLTAVVRLETTATQQESAAVAAWAGALAEPVPIPAGP
ncbi:MAG TPA: hypothetical protein VNP92_14255, partial [Actinophytocola sp.]|nr:hypothetical protein [Actinophytocola sp.]